jgi:hypothetical protein
METVGVESEFEPFAEPGGSLAWPSHMLEPLDCSGDKCSSQTAKQQVALARYCVSIHVSGDKRSRDPRGDLTSVKLVLCFPQP